MRPVVMFPPSVCSSTRPPICGLDVAGTRRNFQIVVGGNTYDVLNPELRAIGMLRQGSGNSTPLRFAMGRDCVCVEEGFARVPIGIGFHMDV